MLLKRHLKSFSAALACLAFAGAVAAQFGPTPHPEFRKPLAERLAAVPNLDGRLVALEKALDAAKDQTSLSATTARYTLEILKDAKANPGSYVRPARQPGAPREARPAAPAAPLKKLSEYVSPINPLEVDLNAELTRAEQIAVAIKAGKDPMAGITGDVHLAYRSSLDGMLMPFRIFVPKSYTPKSAAPLVMFLHGAACDENTFMAEDVLQPPAERLGYIVASINGRGPRSGYSKESGAHQDLLDVMALMEKYYKIDPSRVFLTGHSMGGMGTWTLGLEYRDKFAALATQAGTREMPDLDTKLATGKKIPILITVGGKDTNVPPGPATGVYAQLKAAGFPAKLVEYPEADHEGVFYNSAPEVFWWFETHSK